MNPTRADVLASRSGDTEAFARLVRAHAGSVCAVTTAILGSQIAGEEIAQEAFVGAWQGLGKLQDPDKFGSWLRGIARNLAREARRTKLSRRETPDASLEALAGPGPTAEQRLDGAREEATLWQALEELDEPDREVLVLYYREGNSVEQVASQLELAEPTVRKRLSRARERLRDDVEERLGRRIAHSAPRAAAIALAVAAAIALPPPAHAATLGDIPRLAARAAPFAAAAGAVLTLSVLGGYAELRSDLPEIAPAAQPVLASVASDGAFATLPLPASKDVPEHVVYAFLAAEDARFFEHGPVDMWAIGRAALANWNGGMQQGGSTITQQLAKGMLREEMPAPTVRRKLSEIVLATELERRLTKDEILQSYLDGVYLGEGVWGISDAAALYFDKAPSALTLGEGALLAAIPSHPDANNPLTRPERARSRRDTILANMVVQGWITREEADAASAESLPGGR